MARPVAAYAGAVCGAGARVGCRCRCSTRTTPCGSGSCSATQDDPDSLLAEQVAYWRQALAGAPEELALPVDRPRPAVASHRGLEVAGAEFRLRCMRGLVGLARERGVTMFMVLQAAVAVLLSRLGAGDDIPLGTAVAGRTDEALDDLVGFFVNTLVLRTDLSGDPSFDELLDRVRESGLEALRASGRALRAAGGGAGPGPRPWPPPPVPGHAHPAEHGDDAPGCSGERIAPFATGAPAARFDLDFGFRERFDAEGRPAGIRAVCCSRADLFDQSTADSVMAAPAGRCWRRCLPTRHARSPDQLLDEAERQRVCWSGTTRRRTCRLARCRSCSRRRWRVTPDAVAVVSEGVEVTVCRVGRAGQSAGAVADRRGVWGRSRWWRW